MVVKETTRPARRNNAPTLPKDAPEFEVNRNRPDNIHYRGGYTDKEEVLHEKGRYHRQPDNGSGDKTCRPAPANE